MAEMFLRIALVFVFPSLLRSFQNQFNTVPVSKASLHPLKCDDTGNGIISLPYGSTEILDIDGLKCMRCVGRVLKILQSVDPFVQVTFNPPQIIIDSAIAHSKITEILHEAGNYSIRYKTSHSKLSNIGKRKITWQTFIPVMAVWSGISLLTGLTQLRHGKFIANVAMRNFMGIYFIVFSFFKLSNRQGFATSFATYDLLASKFRIYGRVYPFLELIVGILHLRNFSSRYLNTLTFVWMTFSSLGVLKALQRGDQIQCACLGTWFDLPMSYISLLEDVIMAAMSLFALYFH